MATRDEAPSSSAFKAAKGATLTLIDTLEILEAYIFTGYNHSPKPGQVDSRTEIGERGKRQFPFSGRHVDWDIKFLIATSIEAPASDYTLWPGRGVHLKDKWYSSPRLLSFRGYKKDFTVRIEPFADSFIYVCIEGRWLVCANSDASLHFGMSDSRLVAMSAESQELSALREELKNEANREAADIVNKKLAEIAKRKSLQDAASEEAATPESNLVAAPEESESSELPFGFDDIETLDEMDNLSCQQ